MEQITDFIISFLFGREGVNCAFIPLVMMGISALASAGSAIASSRANRKNRSSLNALKADKDREYLSEYYRGALDNPGAKAYLKRLGDRIKDRDQAMDTRGVATGATHENRLAQKQSNNEIYSDAMGNLVESEQARRDRLRTQHDNNTIQMNNQEMALNDQEANTWSQVGQGISSAAGALGGAYAGGIAGNIGKMANSLDRQIQRDIRRNI